LGALESLERYGALPPGYYVTCAGRTDGGGAQAQAFFSAMLYAHCENLVYLHTPFRSVEHSPWDSAEQWAERWENVFSPGLGELSSECFDYDRMPVIETGTMPPDLPDAPPEEPTLLVVSHCHWYADACPDSYSLIQTRLRQKYERMSGPVRRAADRLRVAVHIRRGDIGEFDAPRFTPNSVVAWQIEQVSRALAGFPHEIHVYSEGAEEEFWPIQDLAVLHLNGDVFEDLHSLITADVFIMAKSSFSYTAALLSRGIRIYYPFWHAPQQQWIVTDDEGSIPQPCFEKALARHLLVRSARR